MEYFVKVEGENEDITELYGCQDGITVNFDGNSWSMSGMKYKTLVTSPDFQRIDKSKAMIISKGADPEMMVNAFVMSMLNGGRLMWLCFASCIYKLSC